MARFLTPEEIEARKEKPKPPPPPRPEPAFDMQALANALASAVKEIRIPVPTVDVAAPNVVVSPSFTEDRPTKWKFTVKRDKQGYISEITADAE